MTHEHANALMHETAQRHLAVNARHLARRNILVHVDSVSHTHKAAFCSVEQRHRGLLWRTCTVDELAWRAEQALAPLIGLGILPMITVKHTALRNATVSAQPHRLAALHHWFGLIKAWLGLPCFREGFDIHAHDHFGWRKAMFGGPQEAVMVPIAIPVRRGMRR